MNRKHLTMHLAVVGVVTAAILAVWAFRLLDFFQPMWLIGLAALPFFTWLSQRSIAGLPSRTNMVASTVRALLYILIIVALADIQFVRRSDKLGVFFLLDYSASVPEETRDEELAYVNKAVKTKQKRDLAGIIVFAEEPSIEYAPDSELEIASLHSTVNPRYTNLQAAVELAVAALPAGVRKKVVLISDGNQNAGDVMKAVRYANGEQVEIDVLPVAYRAPAEVLMDKVQLPEEVRSNETFDLKVHVRAMQDCPATLTILRNEQPIVQDQVQLKKGKNHFVVPMKLNQPGFFVYSARVSSKQDTILENNEASGHVYIQGDARALFVTPGGRIDEVEHLVAICREEDVEPVVIGSEAFPHQIEQLANYDCIVLANVAASRFNDDQLKMIKTSVRDLGIGLIMIGGQDSFGAGGYEETPVEDALPVSMDVRQKKIMPKGALALILHTCEFAKGNYWAKKITKAAIKTVQPQDEVGVIYYGMKGEEWLFKLREANNKPYLYNLVEKCTPGDMPSFQPPFTMARKALMNSDAMVRHAIVISDGDPAAPSQQDLDILAANKITVSCVAINPHSPRDVGVMKAIAFKTGGRYYFVKDPENLPKIFIKEARVVKRSLIFNKPFQPLLTVSSELTKGVQQQEIPQLNAYIATTEKERALVSIRADNENKDPILAEWRFGLGKAVAFTSDASSNWGKHWIGWPKYKKIWSQIIRWTMRKREQADLNVRSRQDGDRVIVTIDAIDANGNYVNFNKLEGRRVDSRNDGHRLQFQQVGPGRYQAEFSARDSGVNLVNIAYDDPQGRQGFVQAGVSLPYSAEFMELATNTQLLRRITKEGGGQPELLPPDPSLADVFKSNLPPSILMQPIWEYLLIAALLFFMIDVVLRRVILTSSDFSGAWARATGTRSRKEQEEHDATMAALLKRKEKVFADKDTSEEKRDPKTTAKAAQEFKEQLQKKARSEPQEDLEIEQGEGPPPSPSNESGSSDTKEKPKSKESDGATSYTNRLLDAKRRARTKGEDES